MFEAASQIKNQTEREAYMLGEERRLVAELPEGSVKESALARVHDHSREVQRKALEAQLYEEAAQLMVETDEELNMLNEKMKENSVHKTALEALPKKHLEEDQKKKHKKKKKKRHPQLTDALDKVWGAVNDNLLSPVRSTWPFALLSPRSAESSPAVPDETPATAMLSPPTQRIPITKTIDDIMARERSLLGAMPEGLVKDESLRQLHEVEERWLVTAMPPGEVKDAGADELLDSYQSKRSYVRYDRHDAPRHRDGSVRVIQAGIRGRIARRQVGRVMAVRMKTLDLASTQMMISNVDMEVQALEAERLHLLNRLPPSLEREAALIRLSDSEDHVASKVEEAYRIQAAAAVISTLPEGEEKEEALLSLVLDITNLLRSVAESKEELLLDHGALIVSPSMLSCKPSTNAS